MPLDQPESQLTPPNAKEMTFLEHLEELRWHLVRMLVAIAVAMVILFAYIQELVQYVILAPFRSDFPTHRLLCYLNQHFCFQKIEVQMQATDPTEQFTRAILIAAVAGIVITFPYCVWELWRFVRPGLEPQEIKALRGVVAVVSSLFLLGVLFAYFVICPFSLSFFASFKLAPDIQNIWRIGEVIGLIVNLSLAGGILFEMPVIAYVLARLGILGPAVMRKYRRHAIVGVLIIAGILTPSPDILSQILLALPMLLLYELSIRIVARVQEKAQKETAVSEL
jgi:sec-independent protein translocase protein TatC